MSRRSTTAFRCVVVASITAATAAAVYTVAPTLAERTQGATSLIPPPINHDPTQIVGPDSCAECHENEHQVWMNSDHRLGAQTLTRDAEAKRIAKALGVRRIKTDDRCASCHYTTQQVGEKRPKSIAGVSCESCHSAAATWIDPHARFGEGIVSAQDEALEHRTDRLEYCDSMGMVRPARLYELGSACYTCHSISDQELIHTAGHPAGTDFEFASWSQGDVRHNFLRAGSNENPPSEAERLRVMYLVGATLRLEYACRAAANGAPITAVTHAIDNLTKICSATSIPVAAELIEIARGVESDSANAAAAVNQIQAIGASIAEHAIGANNPALDALIPSSHAPDAHE